MQPTQSQKELIETISKTIDSWKSAEDIMSSSHYTDVVDNLIIFKMDYDNGFIDHLTFHVNQILNLVKDAERHTC